MQVDIKLTDEQLKLALQERGYSVADRNVVIDRLNRLANEFDLVVIAANDAVTYDDLAEEVLEELPMEMQRHLVGRILAKYQAPNHLVEEADMFLNNPSYYVATKNVEARS